MQDVFFRPFVCGVDKREAQNGNGNIFRYMFWHESGDSLSRARFDVRWFLPSEQWIIVVFFSRERMEIKKPSRSWQVGQFLVYMALCLACLMFMSRQRDYLVRVTFNIAKNDLIFSCSFMNAQCVATFRRLVIICALKSMQMRTSYSLIALPQNRLLNFMNWHRGGAINRRLRKFNISPDHR